MLNTVGAATAIRAALPGMMAHYKETGTAASVVLFSSVAVQQGFPNHAIISAVKGACRRGAVRARWHACNVCT
jgi:NADP-dependent 3-hydroxy acid dehydrogenase YdfG